MDSKIVENEVIRKIETYEDMLDLLWIFNITDCWYISVNRCKSVEVFRSYACSYNSELRKQREYNYNNDWEKVWN